MFKKSTYGPSSTSLKGCYFDTSKCFNAQKKNPVFSAFSPVVHLAVIHVEHLYILILLSLFSDEFGEGIMYTYR